jgi:hypothetical protein
MRGFGGVPAPDRINRIADQVCLLLYTRCAELNSLYKIAHVQICRHSATA